MFKDRKYNRLSKSDTFLFTKISQKCVTFWSDFWTNFWLQKFQFSRTFPRGLFFPFFSNRLKSTPNNWNAPKMTVVKKQNDRYPKWPLFIQEWPLFLEIKVTVIWTNHSDGESRKFVTKSWIQKWSISPQTQCHPNPIS